MTLKSTFTACVAALALGGCGFELSINITSKPSSEAASAPQPAASAPTKP